MQTQRNFHFKQQSFYENIGYNKQHYKPRHTKTSKTYKYPKDENIPPNQKNQNNQENPIEIQKSLCKSENAIQMLRKTISKLAGNITKNQNSPKSQKQSTIKKLKDFYSKYDKFDHNQVTPKKKLFYEDYSDSLETKSFNSQNTTYNHVTLNFLNKETKNLYKFTCFLENELNVPQKFKHQTINQTLDNDMNTDDEQIQYAKKNLYKQIQEAVQFHKQPQYNNFIK